jgi:hypothetical protein
MSERTAEYKGRTYRLLWIGTTKHGQRAHLQFFDGSKDFWADASAVTVSESTHTPGKYEHGCRNGHKPHQGPCCSGRHGAEYDCGCDCCELD